MQASCSKVDSTDKIYNEVKDSEKHNQLEKYHDLVTSLNECSESRKLSVLDNIHSSLNGQSNNGFIATILSA